MDLEERLNELKSERERAKKLRDACELGTKYFLQRAELSFGIKKLWYKVRAQKLFGKAIRYGGQGADLSLEIIEVRNEARKQIEKDARALGYSNAYLVV